VSERARILLFSIGIMVAVSLSTAGIALYLLYDAAFESQRARLEEVAQSQVSMITAMGLHDTHLGQHDVPGGASAHALGEIVEAHKKFHGFGETGEFTLARREGDQIVWLLGHRYADVEVPKPTPFFSEVAEPMRRALLGESGTLVGLDYRGAEVLAAHEFIPEFGWGVVAKIDVAEINKPFASAALLAVGFALAVIVGGIAWMFHAASPLVQRLEVGVAQRTAELFEANRSLRNEIQERKNTEAALRRMSLVFMDAVDPILIQDLSGRITDLNAEVERAYQWTRDELLGEHIDKIAPPEWRSQQRGLLDRCRRGEPLRSVEGLRQTKSGELVPVLLTLSLLTDEEGRAVAIATIAKDLTQQKHLQQQLRSAAAEAALAEERHRRQLAVDLHDGVGQLLTVVGMRLGMLRDSVPDPARVSQVQEIEQIIAEVDEQISTLSFDLSPPMLDDVGLGAAAQWLAERMGQRLGLHITVEVDGYHELLDDGCRIMLFRALGELLLNVAKHARAKRAHVRLWQEDRFVNVVVADEGVGFDPDTDTSRYGLFSIRERLNHLGGKMEIESAPGAGTTIRLIMPIAAASPEASGGSA
jgi:PAS domain S-box-containing protein